MFSQLTNYTDINGLDFLITISAGVNDILVFHSRPVIESALYLRLWGLSGPGMQFFLPFGLFPIYLAEKSVQIGQETAEIGL